MRLVCFIPLIRFGQLFPFGNPVEICKHADTSGVCLGFNSSHCDTQRYKASLTSGQVL